MASNLIAIASNLLAMASNLRAMASNLIAMASHLIVMAQPNGVTFLVPGWLFSKRTVDLKLHSCWELFFWPFVCVCVCVSASKEDKGS